VNGPRGIVFLVFLAFLAAGVTSCGLRVNRPAAGPGIITSVPSTATTTTTGPPEPGSSAIPTTTNLPPLPTGGSNSPGQSSLSPPTTAGASRNTQLLAVYDRFLHDIAGLDDNLNQSWIAALKQVATARLVNAAERQAQSILNAQEHGIGSLQDDHQLTKITSSTTASVFDCLDEQHWYLIQNTTGQPDPGVTRGYYIGIADLVLQGGRWYVDVWQPSQGQCRF
jgi:hypothetical protein